MSHSSGSYIHPQAFLMDLTLQISHSHTVFFLLLYFTFIPTSYFLFSLQTSLTRNKGSNPEMLPSAAADLCSSESAELQMHASLRIHPQAQTLLHLLGEGMLLLWWSYGAITCSFSLLVQFGAQSPLISVTNTDLDTRVDMMEAYPHGDTPFFPFLLFV